MSARPRRRCAFVPFTIRSHKISRKSGAFPPLFLVLSKVLLKHLGRLSCSPWYWLMLFLAPGFPG